MKRFIDIGFQSCLDSGYPKQFTFYCTVEETFEAFSGVCLWESAEDFAADYSESGGKQIERYLSLIPEEFQ